MYRFVLFDFDGVLVDSVADLADAVNDTLAAFGFPMHSEKRIASFIGHGAENLLKQSFGLLDDDAPLPEGAMAFYRARYLENCTHHTTLYPYVREGLTALSGVGIKMAVVTNKPGDMTLEIMRRLSIDHLFDAVVAPETVSCVKPAPDALFYAMALMNAVPTQTIMVGDSWTDIAAGRNAYVTTCAVLYGIGDATELLQQNPDYRFADFASLCGMLLNGYSQK